MSCCRQQPLPSVQPHLHRIWTGRLPQLFYYYYYWWCHHCLGGFSCWMGWLGIKSFIAKESSHWLTRHRKGLPEIWVPSIWTLIKYSPGFSGMKDTLYVPSPLSFESSSWLVPAVAGESSTKKRSPPVLISANYRARINFSSFFFFRMGQGEEWSNLLFRLLRR